MDDDDSEEEKMRVAKVTASRRKLRGDQRDLLEDLGNIRNVSLCEEVALYILILILIYLYFASGGRRSGPRNV